VCSRSDAQAEAQAALEEELGRDALFARRCREAARRGLALRRAHPPRPKSLDAFALLERTELAPLAEELAQRGMC
jgi:Lhr-like helicase